MLFFNVLGRSFVGTLKGMILRRSIDPSGADSRRRRPTTDEKTDDDDNRITRWRGGDDDDDGQPGTLRLKIDDSRPQINK